MMAQRAWSETSLLREKVTKKEQVQTRLASLPTRHNESPEDGPDQEKCETSVTGKLADIPPPAQTNPPSPRPPFASGRASMSSSSRRLSSCWCRLAVAA